MKKLFIKICKLLGFEILDQNNFYSPTLEKNLNEELSIINEKSIILPLGQVKITKKVSSILIIFRMNTDVEIWDQNRRRLFEFPKIEYSKRSINSLIKAINFCQSKYSKIHIKTIIIDDNLMVFKHPTLYSKPQVILEKGRLCLVIKCKNNWCKIKVDKYNGWIKKNSLWGRI